MHAAIISTGGRRLLGAGTEPLWLYVRSVSAIYTPANPQQLGPAIRVKFFTSPSTIRILKKKVETSDLTRALTWLRTREDELPESDWNAISKALFELWATSYSVEAV